MNAHSRRTSELGLTSRKAIAGFSITEFSQPPYRRLPWHEHTDASICFVVSGSYTERVGRRDRECAPHSMVFKPASEGHSDQFGRFGGTCLLIEISPGRLEGIELAVEGLILEVLVEASRVAVEESTARRPNWLRQAHELIHEGFCEPLTLSAIARAVGIHPSHLARTFRAHYRRSIGDYVRHLRLERASRELTDTGLSLAEIGLRSGFFDQSHFSRTFKGHTGLTPAQFRAASRVRNSRTNPHRAS